MISISFESQVAILFLGKSDPEANPLNTTLSNTTFGLKEQIVFI
jgi:hypothetical protein